MTTKLAYLLAGFLCAATLVNTGRAQNRSRSLNIHVSGRAEHCADLQVRSDGEVAQSAETASVPRSTAPLELRGMQHGVIQVRGWDHADYSVETCKIAVAETKASAALVLSGISVNHTGLSFSAQGLDTSVGQWQVYFLVHAPAGANLDIETSNGPIDISDVMGTIKVRAANGPVSIARSSGTVDAETINGPISLSGGGGEVHLIAKNGPISVNLPKDVWNGVRLEARTQNGPLSMSVPETFVSGIHLETQSNAPVSCRLNACRTAMTDASRGQRVLQMNGSSDTVRLSTENGPVSLGVRKPAVI